MAENLRSINTRILVFEEYRLKMMLIIRCFFGLLTFGCALSFDYCSLSAKNTLCKYKPTSFGSACMKVLPLSVTEADKNMIVTVHNNFRRQVAKGLESRGSPGPQPSAANMREISWDDELATMAQTHAQQCVFTHDDNRNVERFTVGQNIAIQFSTKIISASNWTAQISSWYNEVTGMNKALVSKFPSTSLATIGHYTQIVWAQTYKIGCGIISYYDTSFQPSYPYKLFYVCDYGTAGNFLGQSVFKIGTAASACPASTTAKDGLCA